MITKKQVFGLALLLSSSYAAADTEYCYTTGPRNGNDYADAQFSVLVGDPVTLHVAGKAVTSLPIRNGLWHDMHGDLSGLTGNAVLSTDVNGNPAWIVSLTGSYSQHTQLTVMGSPNYVIAPILEIFPWALGRTGGIGDWYQAVGLLFDNNVLVNYALYPGGNNDVSMWPAPLWGVPCAGG